MKIHNTFWQTFKLEAVSAWGETKFNNEVEEVANLIGVSAYLDDSYIGENNRREIQWNFCKNLFATDADNKSILPKNKTILENSNEVVKRAVKVLAGTYQVKPVRTYKSDKFEEVLESTAINDVMLKADRINTLTGACAIRVKQVDGVIDFITYTPNNYRTVHDSDGNIIEMWIVDYIKSDKRVNGLLYDTNSTEVEYTVWTADTIQKLDGKLNVKQEVANELGFLPFLFMENRGSLKYDYKSNIGGMYELVNGQIVVNEFDMLIRNSNRLSSLTLWHLNNFGNMLKDGGVDINLSMGTAIATNTPLSADGDSPNIDVISSPLTTTEQNENKDIYIARMLSNAGLPSLSINPDPTQNSGIARQVDREELTSYLSEQQYALSIYDKQLGKIIGLVLEKERRILYDTDYAIEYRTNEYIDAVVKLENDKMLLELNIINIYEFAKRQGLDLSNEEIAMKMKENKLINESFNGTDEQTGSE